ncbi:MAG: TIGR00701 family protein [Gammaproteobacteria bacterium RIFCSPHIGHO2_12_FULL_41_15]|nr:MAG: TIGR00701 family protein [Gammaproteobacteria bacterium RIFCSPHIGHO2_12_FULL_41_15]
MQWVVAFHIIFMVAWFAGLFYLPRLFVYHVATKDALGNQRFKVMEHKLFFYIMTPAAILTTIFGVWLLTFNIEYYLHAGWLHWKLMMVVLLWAYHVYCGMLMYQFAQDNNQRSERFYRIFNEIPTLLLITIVILVVVKP